MDAKRHDFSKVNRNPVVVANSSKALLKKRPQLTLQIDRNGTIIRILGSHKQIEKLKTLIEE